MARTAKHLDGQTMESLHLSYPTCACGCGAEVHYPGIEADLVGEELYRRTFSQRRPGSRKPGETAYEPKPWFAGMACFRAYCLVLHPVRKGGPGRPRKSASSEAPGVSVEARSEELSAEVAA